MSTDTDTDMTTADPQIERMRRQLDGPLAAAAVELERSHRLPLTRYVTSGVSGCVVLEALGEHPLDDVLAWAGEMNPGPHWWTLPAGARCPVELYASGLIAGLAVTVRTEVPASTDRMPAHPSTDDVLAAAARDRSPR